MKMRWDGRKFLKRFGWLICSILLIVAMVKYNNFKNDYINLNEIIDYSITDGVLTIEVEKLHELDDRAYKTVEEYVVKKDMR